MALTVVWKLSYAIKNGLLPIAGEISGLERSRKARWKHGAYSAVLPAERRGWKARSIWRDRLFAVLDNADLLSSLMDEVGRLMDNDIVGGLRETCTIALKLWCEQLVVLCPTHDIGTRHQGQGRTAPAALLVAQGVYRLDMRRAPRRDIPGGERHRGQQHNDCGENGRVGGPCAE